MQLLIELVNSQRLRGWICEYLHISLAKDLNVVYRTLYLIFADCLFGQVEASHRDRKVSEAAILTLKTSLVFISSLVCEKEREWILKATDICLFLKPILSNQHHCKEAALLIAYSVA